jgi:hypothetical protein
MRNLYDLEEWAMAKRLSHGVGRNESRSARTTGVATRHPRINRARAQLYLVAGASARPLRLRNVRPIRPATTQVGDSQEVVFWTLVLLLSLATLSYMLWAKVFFRSY